MGRAVSSPWPPYYKATSVSEYFKNSDDKAELGWGARPSVALRTLTISANDCASAPPLSVAARPRPLAPVAADTDIRGANLLCSTVIELGQIKVEDLAIDHGR